MEQFPIDATLVIMVVTIIFSIRGFRDSDFFDRYKFNALAVSEYGDRVRLITSGFLHAGWWHLGMNMIVLYLFGPMLESYLVLQYGMIYGTILFVLLYLLSIPVANLPALMKHRNNAYYNAIGASGAVSAVVFATIILYPTMGMMLFFLPIPMPAFLFGFLYLLGENIMARRGNTGIGHDAHIGGAVFGMLIMLVIDWQVFPQFLGQIAQYVNSFF